MHASQERNLPCAADRFMLSRGALPGPRSQFSKWEDPTCGKSTSCAYNRGRFLPMIKSRNLK